MYRSIKGIDVPQMSPDALNRLLREQLARRRDDQLLRQPRIVRPIDAVHVEIDGRRLANFASNNYLGLSHHPAVIAAAAHATQQYGAGAGASPLITGYTSEHALAEQAIAQWKGTEAAVLLPSGYQAAHAAVQTLARVTEAGGARFLLDKLAHASLIDAAAGTGSPVRTFPHNGLPKLRRLLEAAPPDQLQVVVTESIFSMDGDAADLAAIAQLKRELPFVLLLDEAHASGVYGEAGAGLACEVALQDAVDMTIVTLSKAIGVAGGAICGSADLCAAVANWGRAYVYSTGIPPATAVAVRASIGVMRDEPHRQQRVRALARQLRARLLADGWRISPGDSPIIPLILGEEAAALTASKRLEERGFLVVAVRPPTVPRGTSRLRVTLSCEHTDAEVTQLADALRELRGSCL